MGQVNELYGQSVQLSHKHLRSIESIKDNLVAGCFCFVVHSGTPFGHQCFSRFVLGAFKPQRCACITMSIESKGR